VTGGAEAIITLMALFALGVLACTAIVGVLTRLVRGTEPEPPTPRRWWQRRRGPRTG
jgi:hypothetical protein